MINHKIGVSNSDNDTAVIVISGAILLATFGLVSIQLSNEVGHRREADINENSAYPVTVFL